MVTNVSSEDGPFGGRPRKTHWATIVPTRNPAETVPPIRAPPFSAVEPSGAIGSQRKRFTRDWHPVDGGLAEQASGEAPASPARNWPLRSLHRPRAFTAGSTARNLTKLWCGCGPILSRRADESKRALLSTPASVVTNDSGVDPRQPIGGPALSQPNAAEHCQPIAGVRDRNLTVPARATPP